MSQQKIVALGFGSMDKPQVIQSPLLPALGRGVAVSCYSKFIHLQDEVGSGVNCFGLSFSLS